MLDFIDSHCHLDFAEFDSDRLAVLDECRKLGITNIIVPGVSLEQSQRIIELDFVKKGGFAEEGVFVAVGVHPWWVDKIKNNEGSEEQFISDHLSKFASAASCVAIGECGLDKCIDTSLQRQLQVFSIQIDIASAVSKPLIVHSRRTHNEVIQQLKQKQYTGGGVLHAFSGSYQEAKQYWDLGFYLGVGGVITYDRAKKTQAALKKMPLESLLLETDAPDMPLHGRQGLRNSPTNIPEVAQHLAILRDEPVAQVAKQTTANAKRLFSF